MEPRIAAPQYVNERAKAGELPPGHAFFMYFQGMPAEEAGSRNRRATAGGRRDGLQEVIDASDSPVTRGLRDSISQRQWDLARSCGAKSFAYRLASPLTTGTGIEHPLENGFSFLWPYGIPYLPGSAIKGTVRRAAEMLATGEAAGLTPGQAMTPRWTWPAIWWLFGFDEKSDNMSTAGDDALLETWLRRGAVNGNRDLSVAEFKREFAQLGRNIHARGAVEFWDCFPQGPMAIDIMNPHAGSYYQGKGDGKSTPAECENPIPIFFLTVAEGAAMEFHVSVAEQRLPDRLRRDWQAMLASAFALVAEWLGMGAKTAVGYGALQPDAVAEQRRQAEAVASAKQAEERQARQEAERQRARAEEAERARLAAMNPVERRLEEWARGKEPGGAVAAWVEALGTWPAEERNAAAREMRTRMQAMGLWREQGNPAKDKVVKRTLVVRAVLRESESGT